MRAFDADNNTTTSVTLNDTLSLEIQKKPKGGPSKVEVVVNKCGYVDLDGDGVWDGWGDARGSSIMRYMRRDGAWVRVRLTRGGYGTGPELSLDEKTEYTWDGKEWTSRAVGR